MIMTKKNRLFAGMAATRDQDALDAADAEKMV